MHTSIMKCQNKFGVGMLLVAHLITTASPLRATPPPPKPLTRYADSTGLHADAMLAKQLLQRGRKHLADGRYRAACVLLEKSNELDATTPAKFALAQCYDNTDRHARAWSLLEDIANTSKIPAHAAVARELMSVIAPSVGKIVIYLPQPGKRPSGLQIHVDGALVDNAQWRETGRVEILMDLGEHVVMATAKEKIPWQRSFLVTSHNKPVTISIPELGNEQRLPPSSPPPKHTTSPLALSLASFGTLAFMGGLTAFAIGAVQQESRADLFVPSSAFLAVGGVAVATSIWLSLDPAKPSNASAENRIPLRVFATVGANHAFATVQAHF